MGMSDQSPESRPSPGEALPVSSIAPSGSNATIPLPPPPPLSRHQPPPLPFAGSPRRDPPSRPPVHDPRIATTYHPSPAAAPPQPGYATQVYGYQQPVSHAPPYYAAQQPAYIVQHTTQSPPTSSGLAVGSLVCGILGFLFLPLIGSLLAVICGRMALTEIESSRGRIGGSGMAMAGLIMGYIQLAGWALLFFFFFIIGRQIANA
jgi:hypothetical protein